jgi:hypothetical protein
MVNPQVNLVLSTDIRTPDLKIAEELKVEMAITYDFIKNASYLEILSGGSKDYDYYFICDQFRTTITYENNDNDQPFTYKIEQLFTDPYCILNEPMTGVVLHVKNKQGQVLASYSSNYEYNQLNKKQVLYKYFQEVEQPPSDTITSDTIAYLDNIENGSMTTYDGLMSQVETINDTVSPQTDDQYVEKFILRLPFISEDFFYKKSALEMFELFNAYFIMDVTEQFLTYNTLATQSFHNTIDIPPKYYDSLFDKNTNSYNDSPKLPINIEIHADRIMFMSSKFETTSDLEIALRIEIIKFLKQKEGFAIEFYQTDLENYLYETFSPLIKNVNVLSPTMFIVNSTSEIYRIQKENLSLPEILDFTPPYFHFDYNNINLKITW